MEAPDPTRDGHGRFANGNPGGPGRRPERASEQLRRAVEEAITPDHVTAVMRRVLRMSLEGNLTATRILLERACGRPAEAAAPGAALSVVLPRMRTATECNLAIESVAEAVCQGSVNMDAAKVLLDVIQTRLKAIEVNDLEQRIGELEKAAASVDLPGRR